MPAAMMAKVNSVVIFGDPDNPKPVQGASTAKTQVICHTGDQICAGQDVILAPHLTYSQNAMQAAQFVQKNAGKVWSC
jgi:cutinase